MSLKFTKPAAKKATEPKAAVGKATKTTVSKSKGQVATEEHHEEDVIVDKEVVAEHATSEALTYVGMSASYTHNLGDFCSTRVEWSLTIPCKPEEVNDAGDYVKSWVSGRLENDVKEIRGE